MRTTRRLAALGTAAALLVSIGCGSDADKADDGGAGDSGGEAGDSGSGSPAGFEASPGYLSRVIDETSGEAYRFEVGMDLGFGGETIDFGGPIATGEFDGTRQHMLMDMGVMFEGMAGQFGGAEEVPSELTGGDMSVEYVIDTDAMYIRAPFFATAFGSVPAGTDLGEAGGLLESFGSLGESWGRVELGALGDTLPSEAASALGGGQTFDPQLFLDMLSDAEGVEELGTEEIGGETVNGLAAEVSMTDLLGAQNIDPEDLGPEAEGMSDLSFPLEAWIDGDDQIRRITFSFDSESFADVTEESGQDFAELDALGDMSFGTTIDFSDYGDESISVDVPAGDDVVDITDSFVSGFESLEDLSVDADDLGVDTEGLPTD